jgi:hypothetical protein
MLRSRLVREVVERGHHGGRVPDGAAGEHLVDRGGAR